MNSLIRRLLYDLSKECPSLAIGIYKYLYGLSLAILGEVFKFNEIIPCDLRMRNELYVTNPLTVIYGTKTIFFLSPKICALIP